MLMLVWLLVVVPGMLLVVVLVWVGVGVGVVAVGVKGGGLVPAVVL